MIFSTVALLPLFLIDHFGIDKEVATASISLIYFAGLWAGPLGGHISDRLSRVPIILAMCFAAGPVIYLLNLAPYGLGIGALLAILGVIIYVNTTVTQAYIVDQTSERNRSTLLGIYFFGNMEGSGVLTPVIGYFIDRFGFYSSFTVVGAAVLAVALASSLFIWTRRD